MTSVRYLLVAFALTLITFGATARASEAKLECANEAVIAATTKNFKKFGASTNSCGAKLLSEGAYRETYLVCVSDETDPSEWLVVIEKTPIDRRGEVTGEKCKIEFADVQYDSETPNFEEDTEVLFTKDCSMDQADGGKLHCR